MMMYVGSSMFACHMMFILTCETIKKNGKMLTYLKYMHVRIQRARYTHDISIHFTTKNGLACHKGRASVK